MQRLRMGVVCLFLLSGATRESMAEQVQVKPLLAQINAVGPQGKGHREATLAWQKLARAEFDQIPEILAGVDAKNPVGD